MTESVGFKFGIGRLMVLTSVVAIAMTISIRFHAPILSQGLFAIYLVSLAGWAVVRGPAVVADLREIKVKRRKIQERRLELESELRHRKSVDRAKAETSAGRASGVPWGERRLDPKEEKGS